MLFKVNLRETGRWLCARRSITGPLGGMKNGKGVLAGVGVIEQRRNDLIYDNWRFSSRWCCPLFPVDFHIIILIWLERRAKSRRIWISHRLDFRGRHLFTFYSAVEWKALCMLFTWNVSDRQWSASWLELIPTFFFFFQAIEMNSLNADQNFISRNPECWQFMTENMLIGWKFSFQVLNRR